jgi:serine palmitoyltransferase
VPLDALVRLKHEFSYRLILDESLSFGTLGRTGRGVTELFSEKTGSPIRYMHDIEIVTISLENALGSIGGITAGNHEIVDHQRLSGSGYCFSASTPPMAATAAMAALDLLAHQDQSNDRSLPQRLQVNRRYLVDQLREFCTARLDDVLVLSSDEESPLILLQLADIPETQDLNEIAFLQAVVQECLYQHDVAMVVTGPSALLYNNPRPPNFRDWLLRNPHSAPSPAGAASSLPGGILPAAVASGSEPPPGIRLTVSAAHTKDDLDRVVHALGDAVDGVMNRLSDAQKE